jgi:hypothetical protein
MKTYGSLQASLMAIENITACAGLPTVEVLMREYGAEDL